jgi:hypothetical protein
MKYKYFSIFIPIGFALTFVPNYKLHLVQFKYLFASINDHIILNTSYTLKDLEYYKNNRDKMFILYRYINLNLEQIINLNLNLDDFACEKLYRCVEDNFNNILFNNEILIYKIIKSQSKLKNQYLYKLYTDYPNYFLWKSKKFIDITIKYECFDLLDDIVKNHYLLKHYKEYYDCLFFYNKRNDDDKYYCILEYINQIYLSESNIKLFEYMKKQDYFIKYQKSLLNSQTIKYNNDKITPDFLELFNKLSQDDKDDITTDYVLVSWENYKKIMMEEYVKKGYYSKAIYIWNMKNFIYLKNIQILLENGGRYDPKGNLGRYVNFEFDKMKMTNLIELLGKYKSH